MSIQADPASGRHSGAAGHAGLGEKAQPATALKAFPNWTLTTGASSKYLSAVNFEPLPANEKTVAKNLVSSISG